MLRAFGPGRYAKAAERLREGGAPDYHLSFLAREADRLVGCVQLWPVTIGGAPAILLGPIAVEPAYRHHGLGGALIERACAAAAEAGAPSPGGAGRRRVPASSARTASRPREKW